LPRRSGSNVATSISIAAESAFADTCDARRVHRDTFFSCPRCACGLDPKGTRLSCGQCHGTFVPETELIDQICTEQAMALLRPRGFPWKNPEQQPTIATFVRKLGPPITSPEAAFACPRCMTTMTKHQLFTVVLDRCLAHGVWLAGQNALETILESATAGL